jgi:GT2 family glycosyltransferase
VVKCRFAEQGIVVRLAAAVENLGYGGGVNAWLERIMTHPGWEAVLVLNPDTTVDPCSLSKLMAKAAEGYGMVGAALVFDDDPRKIINYGLSWSRFTGRVIAVGRNAPAAAVPPAETIAALDAVSGACVLVSRGFVEEAGLMAEDYFLYMEDLDWGRRRGSQRIGFAPDAVVRHVGGTSIGSSINPRRRSRLSVYLTARNSLLYARRCAGWLWIVHAVVGLGYALRYILQGVPASARITIEGMIDGARGKAGRPEVRLD